MTLIQQYPKEYNSYSSAKDRCNNPRCGDYCRYGARGIKFLFNSFQEFLEHIGPKPASNLSLDRIDNNGNYEPGNIRWATGVEQQANRRYVSSEIVTSRAKELKKKIVMTELPVDLYIRMNLIRQMIGLSVNQFVRGMIAEYVDSLEKELEIQKESRHRVEGEKIEPSRGGMKMSIENPRLLVREKAKKE
jgi:hypothetical protein